MDHSQDVKTLVRDFCRQNRIDIVGFASVKSWDDYNEVPEDFRPQSIWPNTETVIVMGIAMPLPIVETTPSILHKEMYDTCNRGIHQMSAENRNTAITVHVYGSSMRKGYIQIYDLHYNKIRRIYPVIEHKRVLALRAMGSIKSDWARQVLEKASQSAFLPEYTIMESRAALQQQQK